MSVASSELLRVETASEPPPAAGKPPETASYQPGDTVYIGSALPGPGYAAPPPPPEEPGVYGDSGYGFTGYGWGGYGPPPRPVPAPPVRSSIGPNGFPILAPPGSPGSVPPAIGSNGFPILVPQPPAPQPRRP